MEQSNNLFELQVDHQGSSFLRETAKWAKFLAIVGFVIMGLFLLVIVFAGASLSALMSSQYGGASSGFGVMWMIMMVAFMLIYFFPTLYLYKFATKMQVALRNNDQETLNSSFENLKSCFKFMGILMIILLSFYALAFIFGMLGALATI